MNKNEQKHKANPEQNSPEQNSHEQSSPEQKSNAQDKAVTTGYFRWQGLLGFAALLSLIAALLFVFADKLVKTGIEQGGSWYWGAEVNVNDVDIHWSPLRLDLRGVEATDPEQPEQNKFNFAHASASVDLWQALLGRALIHELVIDGVQLDQPRKSPGEVFDKMGAVKALVKDHSAASLFDGGMQALPKPEDILQGSSLKTVKAGLHLQQTYQNEKQQIADLLKQLPDQSKIETYKEAIKRLKQTKIKSPAQLAQLKVEFDRLKSQFKQDKAQLKLAKAQFDAAKNNIAKAVTALKDAPAQDWQEISQRYPLNGDGAKNITQLLLGDQAGRYHQQAMQVWQKLSPLLNKLNKNAQADQQNQELASQATNGGRFIHFPEDKPMPDWLIENARIGLQLEQGNFTLQLSEVNAQHWLRNQPTQINIQSQDVLTSGALTLTATLFISEQNQVRSNSHWQLKELPLSQLSLSQDKALELTLATAKLAIDGQFAYGEQDGGQAEQEINSRNQFRLSQAKFSGRADNKVAHLLLDTLTDIDTLAIDLTAQGNIAAPKFSINSALDKILGQAIKRSLTTSLNKFKAKTQAGLSQKMSQELKLSQSEAKQLAAMGEDFNSIDQALENLLKSQIDDQLKDKVKDKLLKNLGKLFG